jgi:hypothetical protein
VFTLYISCVLLQVANPHDMLLWAKAAQRRAKQEGREMTEEAAAAMGGGGLRPEQLDQVSCAFGVNQGEVSMCCCCCLAITEAFEQL